MIIRVPKSIFVFALGFAMSVSPLSALAQRYEILSIQPIKAMPPGGTRGPQTNKYPPGLSVPQTNSIPQMGANPGYSQPSWNANNLGNWGGFGARTRFQPNSMPNPNIQRAWMPNRRPSGRRLTRFRSRNAYGEAMGSSYVPQGQSQSYGGQGLGFANPPARSVGSSASVGVGPSANRVDTRGPSPDRQPIERLYRSPRTESIPEPPLESHSGSLVVISNPASNAAVITYTLNGQPYALEPGSQHELAGSFPWTIGFDRGSDSGHARYRLSDGKYKFTVKGNRWNLFRQRSSDRIAGNVR